MDIDTTAPGITRDEILIDAPLDAVWRIQTNISAWLTWRPEVSQELKPSGQVPSEYQRITHPESA